MTYESRGRSKEVMRHSDQGSYYINRQLGRYCAVTD